MRALTILAALAVMTSGAGAQTPSAPSVMSETPAGEGPMRPLTRAELQSRLDRVNAEIEEASGAPTKDASRLRFLADVKQDLEALIAIEPETAPGPAARDEESKR